MRQDGTSNGFLYQFTDPDGEAFISLSAAARGASTAHLRARAFAPARPPIEADDRRVLLRTVSHGASGHSIIFHPDRKVFEIAKARTDSPAWDAPDAAWTTFAFDDLFRI